MLDQFDNPPNGNPVLPVASAINDTAGGALAYSAFSYSDHSTTAATLAVPSGKYCAGSGVTAQLQQGQRGWKGINSRYAPLLSLFASPVIQQDHLPFGRP